MADSPVWMAISAAKAGLSARAGLRAARDSGVSIRDSTWFRLFSNAKTAIAGASEEMSRPLDRRPVSSEIFTFDTKVGSGYLQHVNVYVRVRETGDVEVRPYSVTSDDLLRRGDVIDTAISAFSDAADRYGEQVLGAAYTGTYIMIPGTE